MLIDASHSEEMRVAVIEENNLVDYEFENSSKKPLKGNIYLAKVVRVEPSLQAAFVEYGSGRHGFLAFNEIHPDYFRIPVSDRKEAETSDLSENDFSMPASYEGDKESSFKNSNIYKQYKIQEVIKSRQILLIQVLKEERGNKGAALTTYISLPGRYCVLMPNAMNSGGISRRITDVDDRKRLRQLLDDLEVPEGMSLILRTAGLDRSKLEVKRDYKYLMNLWSGIREETFKATAPSLIYEEGNLIRRCLRDMYNNDIEEVIIEGDEGFKLAKGFMKELTPSHVKRIKHYKSDDGKRLFQRYSVDKHIDRIFEPRVQLPSGGYLIISPTEALTAIDVNSGKSTKERHIDNTAHKTNIEAAVEVARQIHLRDLAGLIVVDFIDMSDPRHNAAVEKKFKESISGDRARIQIGKISQFGLLEMSRQRLRPSVYDSNTEPCKACGGAGFVRSPDSLAFQVLRTIEDMLQAGYEEDAIKAYVTAPVGFYFLNELHNELNALKEQFEKKIIISYDHNIVGNSFRVEDLEQRILFDYCSGEKKLSSPQEEEGNRRYQGSSFSSDRRRNGSDRNANASQRNNSLDKKDSPRQRSNKYQGNDKRNQRSGGYDKRREPVKNPTPQKKSWWQKLFD